MAGKPTTLSEEIRAAVDASGLSRYRICKLIGITQGTFSRFMHGGWLGRPNIDALAALLDLHIAAGPKGPGRPGRKDR